MPSGSAICSWAANNSQHTYPSRDGERYADAELAKRIGDALKMGKAEFSAYLDKHGCAGYGDEEIVMMPLALDGGGELYRARPGAPLLQTSRGRFWSLSTEVWHSYLYHNLTGRWPQRDRHNSTV
jgi:hypothetical protein